MLRRARRLRVVRRTGALLERWVKGAGAAAVGAAESTVHFFQAVWHVTRTEGVAGVLRHSWQFFVTQGFSSLTRRIVFLNVFGLLALMVTIVPLNQVRAGLIEASVRSLLVQGEMIAGAIAGAATVENDSTSITVDPNRLLELQTGETYGPPDDFAFDFSINPERVGPLLRRLVGPTNTRARVYGSDGSLILDTRNINFRGDVAQSDLPTPTNADKQSRIERFITTVRRGLFGGDLPRYHELGAENGKGYPEVVQALQGHNANVVRADDRERAIVTVAVPVQRFRAVRGVVLLSTQ